MADNVYLLETRLSLPQQAALSAVREVARQHSLTVFLVGGAVRDLMSGSPVRDLDVAVQGDALELRADLEASGGVVSGENAAQQALFLRFPGGVRLEVGSTLSVTYPKPGEPVYQPTSMLDDLRRRDFTANAMALSLNDGSYGLLMDPLNGVADIENRELRLVSNYGFIEDPIRMIRAARLMARLGWQMDERTRGRYDTGKEENYIAAMQPASRDYELEELFHEEDPLRVMRRLEEEGWLGQLSPALGVAKANVAELGRLREVQMQFQTRGIAADGASANFALLTAKLSAKEIEDIRRSFPRQGFVEEIGTLESSAKELASKLLSKELAAPSAAFQYLMKAPAAVVVYLAYSSRSTALQARFKSFLTEWPTAQSKVPYVLMQEMRIVPELPDYVEIVEKVTFALMDGKLETVEEMKAFLEPFSPPAPPPPVSLRRPRAPRKEAKAKGRKKAAAVAPVESDEDDDELLSDAGAERETAEGGDGEAEEDSDSDDVEPTRKTTARAEKPAAPVAAKAPVPLKPVAIPKNAVPAKPIAVAPVPAKAAAKTETAAKAEAPKPSRAVTKAAPETGGHKTAAPKGKAVPAKKSAAPAKGAKAASAGKSSGKGAAAGKVVSGGRAAGSKATGAKQASKKVSPAKPVASASKAGGAKGAAPAKATKAIAKKATASKPAKKAVTKSAPAKRPANAGKSSASGAKKSAKKKR